MTTPDRIAEIRAAIAAMTFDRFGHEDAWSVDPHGDGWALMLGSGRGMHGLNMVHLTDPSYQWPTVGRYMLAAMNGAPALLAALDDRDREIERLRAELVDASRRRAWADERRLRAEKDAIALRAENARLAEGTHRAVEVAMMRADADTVADIRDGAFRAGAEAMREAIIKACEAEVVRALPVPEAKR